MFENGGRGIGEKGKDNGLLVVVAVKDRRVKVEVGYELEQFITDGFAGQVSRDDMAPQFRQGNYGAGLVAGVQRIVGPHRAGPQRHAAGRAAGAANQRATAPRERRRRRLSGAVRAFIVLNAIVRPARPASPPGLGRRAGWSSWNSGVGPFSGRAAAGSAGLAAAASAAAVAGLAALAAAAAAVAAAAAAGKAGRCLLAPLSRGGGKVRRGMKTTTDAYCAAICCWTVAAVAASGCSYNTFVEPGRGDQDAVGAGGEPAPAPQRPDPEPGGDHQGHRPAGAGRLRPDRRVAGQAGGRHHARAAHRRRPTSRARRLARLLVVVENYPELQSNESFNRLMDELSGTENRIAVERMRYNERVQEYNTQRRRFPSNVTASIFGFKEHPLFDAPPAAEQVPKVNFQPAVVRSAHVAWRWSTTCCPSSTTRWPPRASCSSACPTIGSSWKPHAKSFSLGQLAQHVANIPMWGVRSPSSASWTWLALPDRPPSSAAARRLVKLFDDNAAKARKELVGKTDAELMAPWALKRGDRHDLHDAQGHASGAAS